MGRWSGWGARATRWGHRLQARLAARVRPRGALVWPEPRITGDLGRGRQILRGRLRIGEELVEAPGAMIWDLAPQEPEARALHGFRWLDDLLVLGEPQSRALAQAWVVEWIARYGRGAGPGWTPELAADRLIQWLGHARALLHPPGVGDARLGWAVAAQARFLARRWKRAPEGRPRLAALTALLLVRLVLPGQRPFVARATRDLAQEAARVVDAQGAVATRNPEDLLDIVSLLVAANQALAAADLPPDPAIGGAIARAAPVLRALRHADGSLGRFHGGCRGAEGRLDQVLAAAGRPSQTTVRGGVPLHMGFLRMAAGRTTLVADAAAPPVGAASLAAHASTLAFELTSGRRPLIVNIGPGTTFGSRWRRAARATPSHSTLGLDMVSSSRLGLLQPGEETSRLAETPSQVIVESGPQDHGTTVNLAHDGWRASHGLTHARVLQMSPDGRLLKGEDMLTTLSEPDVAAFGRAFEATNGLGIAFALRFHLHPDVEAEMTARGDVALLLRSGEEWTFSVEEGGAAVLEPSVYLENGRLRPRSTLQIVMEGRMLRPMARLRWTLGKAYGTPEALRDLNPRPDWDEEDQ